MDRAGQAKRANGFASLFEIWEAKRAFPLASFFEFDTAEKVLVGFIQVPECLLRSAFRYLVYPGGVGLLELVQISMQFHSRRTTASRTVDLLRVSQPPVVREPGRARMLHAGGFLLII